MALNTEPLNTTRRALLVSVLLVFFVGSLGLAQWLSVSRRSALALSVWIPQEFPTALAVQIPGLYAARGGSVAGEPRKLYYFFYEHVPAGDLASLRAEARRLFVETVGHRPAEESRVVLCDHPGVEVQGMSGLNGGFAILRFTVVADRAVGILYSGSTSATDADSEVFTRLADGIRVRDLGQRRPPGQEIRGTK